MNAPPRFGIAAATAVVIGCSTAAPVVRANNIAVTAWSLSTGIQDNVGQTVHGFGTPMNPFVNFDGVMRVASTAQSAYMIYYARQALSFMVTSDHHCQHTGNFPRCSSAGDIFITTTNEMLVSVTSSVDYSFSAENTAAGTSFGIIELSSGNPHLIFSVSDSADALFDPQIGQLTLISQYLLPAGGIYEFSYGLDTSFLPGALNGGVSNLYGTMNFSLNPVPEPAGLTVGAMSAALFFRRRS